MTPLEAAVIAVAGVCAGAINTVVGSGTLITFPVLLALGYPPVVANASNSIGLVPGGVAGAIGYRYELTGQRKRLLRLGGASLLGGITGALLLLVLSPDVFETVVPILIVIALILVVAQPWLSRRLASMERHEHGGASAIAAAYGAGVYGGYFGAAQGVLLVGMLGILMDEGLQRLNALKNVLTAGVNLVAGLVFVAIADVDWLVVLLIAAGSTAGGILGAKIGRRLPPVVLRGLIVLVGLVAVVLLVTD
ncbi:sulfite exporter TauE/SafE family protein [Kibdelosporangium philippinense]|uniref:Probable membrane transporter protein n=1 Tax=Kibdelosporangium philippinense TaxID=211113 RepID=A0ABS8ZP27_9PSEU|nr:sulfite exporter TauE/SafE family protein [Kibdelosporangium philippinense]MCE7009494.1 sulfite exporter TauE/SafE family protein [Kibdelosporangium philippinense]